MRTLCLLLSAATVAACTTSPPQARSAAAQQQLQKLLAGKTAGVPLTCLPSFGTPNMVVIDDNTIVFRDGASRLWKSEMRDGCSQLGSGFYTLVTRSLGGRGPCSGDIARVADLTTGTTVGSCAWGEFVPYTDKRP